MLNPPPYLALPMDPVYLPEEAHLLELHIYPNRQNLIQSKHWRLLVQFPLSGYHTFHFFLQKLFVLFSTTLLRVLQTPFLFKYSVSPLLDRVSEKLS